MLHITDLTYRIGERLLFDQATAAITPGQKVGLVGPNGAGKSTLFKLILDQASPEGGRVSIQPRARVGHVAQEAAGGPESLLQTVLSADTERLALLTEAQTASAPERIAEIHTRLADIDAHSAEARAAKLLSGLGFSEAAQQRPCHAFSGGWRMRVSLARVLFTAPDLLLLDEPTNYLDLEGVLWLETYLKNYPHTAVIISHDRSLLNGAVNRILHLDGAKLYLYTGGYDAFDAARRERMDQQMALRSKVEAQRRHIESFVARFRSKASKAKQAQSRLKMLDRLQPIPAVAETRTRPLHFPDPDPLSSPLVTFDGVEAGYGDDPALFRSLTFRLDMDDRIALLGANGNGKSTLAKLISGRLRPRAGKIRKPRKLKIGYFAQHQLDELIPKQSAYDHLERALPDLTEAKRRARLGGFGFGEDKADRAVETLSGGEKARLLLALATLERPHLLILDEPTNHLDVDTRSALIQAINDYDGAVILISHDRFLVETCADRLWMVDSGHAQPFDGDLEDYKAHILAQREQNKAETAPISKPVSQVSAQETRRVAADRRARLQPLRQKVEKAESAATLLAQHCDTLRAKLADPSLYDRNDVSSRQRITKLQQKLAEYQTKLDLAEQAWLKAADALETAENRPFTD